MLRSSARTRHIPIIFLTARGEKQDRIKGLGEVQAEYYIVKPFDIEEVHTIVKGALDRTRQKNLAHPVTNLPTAELINEQYRHLVSSTGWALAQAHINGFELFTQAYELDADTALESRDALLDELGFARYLDYRVEDLSGGTRQKLNLTLALLHEPRLLLLDEPYAGFDWETYLRFWEMAERRRADGMGILIVSHLLAERERLTRIYELRDGRCEVLS